MFSNVASVSSILTPHFCNFSFSPIFHTEHFFILRNSNGWDKRKIMKAKKLRK
jgi:hypothetical protein